MDVVDASKGKIGSHAVLLVPSSLFMAHVSKAISSDSQLNQLGDQNKIEV